MSNIASGERIEQLLLEIFVRFLLIGRGLSNDVRERELENGHPLARPEDEIRSCCSHVRPASDKCIPGSHRALLRGNDVRLRIRPGRGYARLRHSARLLEPVNHFV